MTITTQPATLELEGVDKVFDGAGGERVRAVIDCNLQLVPGEFLTLLGPSGCGKTTLLRLVAGFEEPTAGRILLDGAPIEHRPPNHRDMAMVFQNYALFPHMSVYANVSYSLRLRGERRATVRDKVTEALRLVGLPGMEERSPSQLSGGQQQRVALARALVKEPAILLLDEPLSNLDALLRVQMRTEIRRIQRSLGTTTLYVTHDQEEAIAVSDRIAVMNAGRVDQVGSPRDVYERPASRFVAEFFGSVNLVPATVVAQRSDGCRVETLGAEIDLDAPFDPDSMRLMVRPESVHVRRLVDDPSAVRATVTSATYLGVWLDLHLDVGGVNLKAHVLSERGADLPEAGDTVGVHIDPSAFHPIAAT